MMWLAVAVGVLALVLGALAWWRNAATARQLVEFERTAERDRRAWRLRAERAQEYWDRLQAGCDHRWHNLHGGDRVCEFCGARSSELEERAS